MKKKFFLFLSLATLSLFSLVSNSHSIEYNMAPGPVPSLEEANIICQKFEKQINLTGYQKAGPASAIIVDFFKSTINDKYQFNVVLCGIPLKKGGKFGYFVYLTNPPKLGPVKGIIEKP